MSEVKSLCRRAFLPRIFSSIEVLVRLMSCGLLEQCQMNMVAYLCAKLDAVSGRSSNLIVILGLPMET